ncbi:MAG TPA: SCO family protein [Macromonas sp.]|nr:SCO family protein [Macromonas sp.]
MSLLIIPSPGWAHGDHQPVPPPAIADSPPTTLAAPRLPDVEVLDQHGRALRFKRDLIQDKLVVVSFIYTSCPAICSPLTANLKQARDLLDPTLAERVRFISISVDPQADTSAALKAYAAQHGIDGDWAFVTGQPAKLRAIQKAFAVETTRKADHTPLVFIGNETRRMWTRKFGLAPPAAIAAAIVELAR